MKMVVVALPEAYLEGLHDLVRLNVSQQVPSVAD